MGPLKPVSAGTPAGLGAGFVARFIVFACQLPTHSFDPLLCPWVVS